MDKNLLKAALVLAALGLVACSSSEPAKTAETKSDTDTAAAKAPAGPPEAVTGKTAFYEMYTPARMWAPDILPLSLKSGEVAGIKNADGKAGVWTAVFGSVAMHMARSYTYAVADQSPTISKGIKADDAVSWSGPTTAVMTFQTGDFTVDSDAAYKTVAEKAADWLKDKENAEKPVSISLGAASRFPAPVWYILFGNTKSGFAAIIDASTGKIVAK